MGVESVTGENDRTGDCPQTDHIVAPSPSYQSFAVANVEGWVNEGG